MNASPVRAPSRLTCCVLLGLAVATGGCGSKAPAVTGLLVTVELSGVEADQIQIGVTTPDGEAFPPTPRPTIPSGALASPQSVSIFLSDALAGATVTCTVTPLSGSLPSGAAVSRSVTLVLHELVPITIELDATPRDGGDVDVDADADDDGAAGTNGGGGTGGAVVDAGAKANGQPCAANGECDSTLCVDGVCCASACGKYCQACNVPGKVGTCAPTLMGTPDVACAAQPQSGCGYDGTCDGSGACQRFPAGIACKVASCNGASYLPASACDGQGTCVAANTVDCAPFLCDASSMTCTTTCKLDTDCAPGRQCQGGSCGVRALKANGAGCVAATDCTSGHCADGVCCGAACTGACVSCNQTAAPGMCLPVAAGKADPHTVCHDAGAASCAKNGLCDGTGACALYPATTVCAAGSCKNATLHQARRCDGKGVCATAMDLDCTPYRCDPTATACFTSCTTPLALQCAARRDCMNGACR
jgi:hypothetical protein